MRELKFRAWDNKNDCWCSETELWLNGAGTLDYGDVPVSEDDDITVEFFTGFNSTFGRQVDWWVGDMLKSPEGKIGVIRYRPEYAQYSVEVNNIFWCSVPSAYHDNWQKVGTIHENPELLEQSDGE